MTNPPNGARWFALSAWSIAPTLFLLEALVLLLALLLVRGVALWLGQDAAEIAAFAILLPGMGLTMFYFGKRCALPPPARFPRGRIIGASLLLGLLYALFLFVVERLLLDAYGDEVLAQLPTVIWISDAQLAESAAQQGLWIACYHLALLPLGLRAAEKNYPPEPPARD
jgi:hypothetical protein